MPAVLTICPFCACGCGVYLNKEDGKLVGVAPSETHAVSRGRLCARGWNAHEACLWGERLTAPLIRRNGILNPVSWSEALAFVVTRLSELSKDGKNIGVLGSPRATNEENYLAAKLARFALGTNNVDFCGRDNYSAIFDGIAEAIAGAPPIATFDSIAASDLILLIEDDLSRTHPRAAVSVMEAVKRGAVLITLGPVKTQMARLATHRMFFRNGSASEDINTLLAAVASINMGGVSVAYRCKGWDAFWQKAEGISVPEEIRQIAEAISKAQRPTFLLSPISVSREQLNRDSAAVASVAVVAGYLDRPDFGFGVLAERSNLFGAWQMGAAHSPFPEFTLPVRDERQRPSVRPGSISSPNSGPGLEAAAMMSSLNGLVVLADDPVNVLPESGATMDALKKMSCLVVLDSFNTATAQLAHVVLPIASFAESDGTYTNMEGRVQRVRAAAEPPGDAKQGWQALAELLNRFGYPAPYRTPNAVFQEITRTFPAYAPISYETLENGKSPMALIAPAKGELDVRMTETKALVTEEYSKLLVRSGAFDWGSDPLIAFSPTLNRDFSAKRKLFPDGVVEMAKADADELGVKHGWKVTLSSSRGEIALPVSVRTDLTPGMLLVPFAFRDCTSKITGGQAAIAIKVDRV